MVRSIGSRSLPAVAGLTVSLFLGWCSTLAGAASCQDLQITELRIEGTPRAGDCNTVIVRVRNTSDRSIDERTGLEVITFPSATPFQDRARSRVTFEALPPHQEATREVEGVHLLGERGTPHTLQAVADVTHRVTETNESNNTTTARRVTPSRGCDSGSPSSAPSEPAGTHQPYSSNSEPDLRQPPNAGLPSSHSPPSHTPPSHPLPRARGPR